MKLDLFVPPFLFNTEHLIPSAPPPAYSEVEQPYSGYQGPPPPPFQPNYTPPHPQYGYPSLPGYQSSHHATTIVVIRVNALAYVWCHLAEDNYLKRDLFSRDKLEFLSYFKFSCFETNILKQKNFSCRRDKIIYLSKINVLVLSKIFLK